MTPEIDANLLKILSAIFMFIGTLLVSWRVTKILRSLSLAVRAMDVNFQVNAARARGENIHNIQVHGMHNQVNEAEKTGTKLLAVGFFMQIIGLACNVMSLLQTN